MDQLQECVHHGGIEEPHNFIRQVQSFLDNSSRIEREFDNRDLHKQMSEFQRNSHSLIHTIAQLEKVKDSEEGTLGVGELKESKPENTNVDDESEPVAKKKKMVKKEFEESLIAEEQRYSCIYCAEEGKEKSFEKQV